MKRIVTISALLGLTALASVAPAASGATGASPYQLGEVAGWTCLVPPPHAVVHCLPPGKSLADPGPAFTTLVFDTTDPQAREAKLLGTELNMRADIYNHSARDPGPPCPQDPDGREYTDLFPLLGIPYFACHHFNSPL